MEVSIKFKFLSLLERDIQYLMRWLREPHVLKFFPEQMTNEQMKQKYLSHITSEIVHPFLIYFSHTPIGYIQAYSASQVGNG